MFEAFTNEQNVCNRVTLFIALAMLTKRFKFALLKSLCYDEVKVYKKANFDSPFRFYVNFSSVYREKK